MGAPHPAEAPDLPSKPPAPGEAGPGSRGSALSSSDGHTATSMGLLHLAAAAALTAELLRGSVSEQLT